MKIFKIVFFFLFLVTGFTGYAQQGFLRAEGQNIVDGNGQNIVLRGMGLGGWMLQEGYMMQTSGFANPQHEIESIIEELVGTEAKEAFYDAWLENYCTKTDIDSMAAWGFNSIRLPIHYKLFTLPIEEEPVAGTDTWLDKGFEMVDELLDWCEANGIYLILDLHAAPGGQGKDAAISDYDSSKPSLWQSNENKRKTIALWKKLAERYTDEPWIGGYDLINEPNWDVDNAGNQNGCNCNQNTALWNLYRDIAAAIRTVDQNHLVIIEGNCWGNRYNGLPNLSTIDDNLVMSFHKYWSYNNDGSISGIMDQRKNRNVPIWLGESGENSNVWFTNAINLVETNNIGWAWWPYKKIGSVTGTVTIPKTNGYQKLLNYWEGNASKPSITDATAWLMEQAEMLKLENCIIHTDVIDAMFRQAQGDKSAKPFKEHRVPGTIFATDYDLGGNGFAYFDNDSADYHVSTDEYIAWNQGYAYRNDAVDIEACTDGTTNGYNVGWMTNDEWLNYTVEVDSTAAYTLELRYAANSSSGKFHLELDDVEITPVTSLSSTGGWATWKTISLSNIVLEKGSHALRFVVDNSGYNINYLSFKDPVEISAVQPEFLQFKTDSEGETIHVVSNIGYNVESVPSAAEFSLSVNGIAAGIASVSVDVENSKILVLELANEVINSDKLKLSYNGTTLMSPYNVAYSTFSNKTVVNEAPSYLLVPGLIQAENYSVNNGFELEDCTDAGNGQNLSYAAAGDYADYAVYNAQAGKYKITYRVASSNSGTFKMQLVSDAGVTDLHSVSVSTGGWQTWQNKSMIAELPAGKFTLRVYVVGGEFNLNWFEIGLQTGVELEELSANELVLIPYSGGLILNNNKLLDGSCTVELYNMAGQRVFSHELELSQMSSIEIPAGNNLQQGIYIGKIKTASAYAIQRVMLGVF